MPYNIRKEGSEWVVYSPHGVKGRHASEEEAKAQQRALYANAPPEEEKHSPKKSHKSEPKPKKQRRSKYDLR